MAIIEVKGDTSTLQWAWNKKRNTKAYGTGSSQAVPHPSTIPARRCLTSVIGRERVFSSWYGRRQLVEVSLPLYSKLSSYRHRMNKKPVPAFAFKIKV